MAVRLRIPWLLDVALVSDSSEMAWLDREDAVRRQISGAGGWLNRIVARRVSKLLAVSGSQLLPVFVPKGDTVRQAAQQRLENELAARLARPEPFDRHAVATLGRYVAGEDLDTPVGLTVQQIVGRLFDETYTATRQSYNDAKVVASALSLCPITALRFFWWRLTGQFVKSRTRLWQLAGGDAQAIHATTIAMHNIVDSLARMRRAMRRDGTWQAPPGEAAARGLVTPPALLREMTDTLSSPARDCPVTPRRHRFGPRTLVVFRLNRMHRDTGSNDLALSRRAWSQCPAHALVPRLLEDAWTAAVRERSAQRHPRRRRSIIYRLVARPVVGFFVWLNGRVAWHALPKGLTWVAFANLWSLREVLREHNVHDTSLLPTTGSAALPPAAPEVLHWRTADGSFNDLADPSMGRAGTRFGRNVPMGDTYPDPLPKLLDPNPRVVSRVLLTRRKFVPAPGFNVLAAAWTQFQVHDWFNHDLELDPSEFIEIPIERGDPWRGPNPMRIQKTRRDPTRADRSAGPPTYINTVTHWWDASQLYGSDEPTQHRVRGGKDRKDGKLFLKDGRIPVRDPVNDPIEITGFNNNWWLGLSLLHHVFTLEHNAICDRLRAEYPRWDDERLFQTARLVNAALIAKIHSLEWSQNLLDNPPVRKGLAFTWWGPLGKRVATTIGRLPWELLTGIPGTRTDHHGVPFAMTEEFVSVYRMHAFMMPDEFSVYAVGGIEPEVRLPVSDILGAGARTVLERYDVPKLLYSFGVNIPGDLRLGNYAPVFQTLRMDPQAPIIDLATIDILRDRERGVPRYNDFRELLHLPRIRSFKELNAEWAEDLEKVYRSVDRIDLMVGLFAEKRPEGFAISDTAFRIFLLMNPRRMQSDRFYTTDYRPAVYSQAGLDWVHDHDMKSVLLRHYPCLAPVLKNVQRIFAPWTKPETCRGS